MSVDINEVGATAFFPAYFRVLEQERDDSLFTDPYAKLFLPDVMRERVGAIHAMIPEIGEMVRYRIYAFNEIVQNEIDKGKRQVVSVGAGFDMRPAILRSEGVRFFDVDQPAVLEYKREVMERNGIEPWTAVGCNYLEVNLPESLAEAGFDASEPTMFVWESNTMYLPVPLIYGFLNRLAAGVESFSIGFDYLSEKVIRRETGIESATRATDFFEHSFGAPWITGFDDVAVFERNTALKVMEARRMEDVGKLHAPEYSEAVEYLSNLYFYCILGK